jgi:predicted metal-binding protein
VSLVTTPASSLAVCGTCAGTRVTAITMTLTDGSSVDFASCHSCETKSWRQGGLELDISTVLGKAKKHKPV